MTGSNALSIVPEVLAAENGGEALLTPGDELSFEHSAGTASVTVNSPSTLISAIVYGRPDKSVSTVVV